MDPNPRASSGVLSGHLRPEELAVGAGNVQETPPSSQAANMTPPPGEEESEPVSDVDPVPRASSGEWPSQLRLRDVGVGTPTVQETPSFAQAAERDEHQQKPRPSVVRTTIKDLLSATRRKVSGKSSQAQPPTDGKDKAALVRESELRGSIADLENIDAQHLPPLQATPDEVANIQSTDGT